MIHPGLRTGVYMAVAEIAAVIILRVRVKDFVISPGSWHANPITVAWHWGKVQNNDQILVRRFAAVTDNGLLHVVTVYPLKTLVVKVVLIQCGMRGIQLVKIFN